MRHDPDTLASLRAPSPCDRCSLRARCAAGEACRAFVLYVSGDRWRGVSREPDESTFVAVMRLDVEEVPAPRRRGRPSKVQPVPRRVSRRAGASVAAA
jgi:hypothetical protein